MKSSAKYRVFVGSDETQEIGVEVLRYSINRSTKLDVDVISMTGLELPDPKTISNRRRTGFSFSRFAIPELCDYSGQAIYMDADMLVMDDIEEVFALPFGSAKVIVQNDLSNNLQPRSKLGAPKRRKKQCAVMKLDCGALDWNPKKIISGLDGKYNYSELMDELCVLDERQISYTLPERWNSLEHYEEGKTANLHYTDMQTQPWVDTNNRFGFLWVNTLIDMVEEGKVSEDRIVNEIQLGHCRPSLLAEIKLGKTNAVRSSSEISALREIDAKAKFKKHKKVYEAKKARKLAEAEELSKSAGGMISVLRKRLANWRN